MATEIRDSTVGFYRQKVTFVFSDNLIGDILIEVLPCFALHHLSTVVSSSGTELIVGQSTNLTCGLGFPLPYDLRLKWVSPGESAVRPVPLDNDPALLHMTLDIVHNGKWRCELWHNHTREATAEITLKIGEARKCRGRGLRAGGEGRSQVVASKRCELSALKQIFFLGDSIAAKNEKQKKQITFYCTASVQFCQSIHSQHVELLAIKINYKPSQILHTGALKPSSPPAPPDDELPACVSPQNPG